VWFVTGSSSSEAPTTNVVLISVDTCRADRLSCYGYPAQTTPHIDALAREGVLFSKAVSPVPLTLPAHCSMLTGVAPPVHGVRNNIGYRLADSHVTLSESLGQMGYRTGAIIGAAVLDSETGVGQGFELYDDDVGVLMTYSGARPERRGDEVARLANAWLDARGSEPFFLFVHLFDPHYPYEPPEPFAARFSGDPYVGEVAFADQCVGSVIETLKRLDLYDSTLIVVAGDHGEGLGEHGEPQHGYFVYCSTTRVPLVIRAPRGCRDVRVAQAVSLTDIVPTVLAQVGATVPLGLGGVDLSDHLSGRAVANEKRLVYSESLTATQFGCSPLLAVETGRWKYIQTSKPELYDLTADPGEQDNLVEAQSERARAMRAGLASLLQDSVDAASGRTTDVPAHQLERLRALGYTGGAVEEHLEFDETHEDPKDFLAAYNQIEAIDECRLRGDRAEAKRLAAALLAVRPDIVQTRRTLARFAMEDGDDQTALAHYEELLSSAPTHHDAPAWHNNLGILLGREGRLDEAAGHYREALHLTMRAAKGIDPMRRRSQEAMHIASVMYSAHLNLGNVLLQTGQTEAAANEFTAAIGVRPTSAEAHTQLGVALSRLGRREQAIAMFQRALQLDPNQPQARRALDAATNRG
jgi:arylsulfatase A-like enzyme/Flp pilus assembly protein TadD